jgi:uncharacterized spore protein YtfJ
MSLVSEDVRTTVDELLKVISTKNVISDPYEVGDKVIITITKIGLGFGTGKGESKANTGPAGAGEGVGGGVGVSPVAIIVIDKSVSGTMGVEVKSLSPPSGIGKAVGEIASQVAHSIADSRMKKDTMQPQAGGDKH